LRVCTAFAALSVALVSSTPEAGAYPASPGGVEEVTIFAVPLEGPLFERFGYARGRLHAGIDIAVLRTDAVRAALPGVVTATGYLPRYWGYGNVVKIRHERGVATMYAHLASMKVKAGEWVERGEVIARAGCTGSCTGPHLHFEVRVRGKLVDPLRYLKGRVR
jgi:murein DD-endopeptidase MepM/ murein hydrolase activator NlpD